MGGSSQLDDNGEATGEGMAHEEGMGQHEERNTSHFELQIEGSDRKQGVSAPLTPATPVDQLETGTVAYLPNGNRDMQSL